MRSKEDGKGKRYLAKKISIVGLIHQGK